MPTRRMLINAQRPEEVRIAIVAGKVLENYQVEAADRSLTRGNIYRGVIVQVQPSLNAAFVDYGADRNGFLAIQDVVPDAYYHQPKGARPRIEEVLEKGRPVVVQVTREPEGTKGAVLTTDLSLAGRYLVLSPFNDNRGVSRKVSDDETRQRLREQAAALPVPKGAGVIVRTNALDRTKRDLNRDLSALLRLWKRIGDAARRGKRVELLYSDQDLILRALRDHLDSAVEEILVDDDRAHAKAEEYLKTFLPRGKVSLVRYTERTPLFSRYDLEAQIDRIYERKMTLPGGGSIVIDRTEALTAIDVNSGRATSSGSQEETAVATNLEAAREVARQLRLRDIGGLLVVDFIDMRAMKNRRKVERTLKEAMKEDKARFTVGRISANGLLEINRQKIQQSLALRTHRPCPTCDGTGRIASPEMVGRNLLRRIEGRAAAGSLGGVRIALHPELADAFQNDRRREIAALEEEFGLRVEVIAASHLHRPEQEIEWIERARGEAPKPPPEPPEAAVQVTEMMTPRAQAEEAVEDAPEGERKRPRKRRRRKRGRGGGDGETDAGNGEAEGEDQRAARGGKAEEPAAEGPGAGEPEEEEEEAAENGNGGTKRRRRRRRRGGRRRGGGGSSPAGVNAASGDDDPNGDPGEPGDDPPSDRAPAGGWGRPENEPPSDRGTVEGWPTPEDDPPSGRGPTASGSASPSDRAPTASWGAPEGAPPSDPGPADDPSPGHRGPTETWGAPGSASPSDRGPTASWGAPEDAPPSDPGPADDPSPGHRGPTETWGAPGSASPSDRGPTASWGAPEGASPSDPGPAKGWRPPDADPPSGHAPALDWRSPAPIPGGGRAPGRRWGNTEPALPADPAPRRPDLGGEDDPIEPAGDGGRGDRPPEDDDLPG